MAATKNTAKQYLREQWRRSISLWEKDELMTSLALAIVALVIAFASTYRFNWPWLTALPNFIATYAVLAILVRFFVLSPMATWKEQREKLDAYEASSLTLDYDDADTTCKRDILLGDASLGERLWRVRVRGSLGKLMEGIVVRVEKVEPSLEDLPQVLHPMDSPWKGGPTEWEGDGSFNIRPDAATYVDVIRYVPSHGTEKDRLELVLQSTTKPLQPSTHTLTLSVQGNHTKRVTKRFQLEVNPHGLTRFYPLEVNVS